MRKVTTVISIIAVLLKHIKTHITHAATGQHVVLVTKMASVYIAGNVLTSQTGKLSYFPFLSKLKSNFDSF